MTYTTEIRFLTVLEAGGLESRCWQVWFPLRSLSSRDGLKMAAFSCVSIWSSLDACLSPLLIRQAVRIRVHSNDLILPCVLVSQLCLTLCNSMDCSLSGSSVHGISQARILEWVAVSFSRGFSGPRDQTLDSCIADRFPTV